MCLGVCLSPSLTFAGALITSPNNVQHCIHIYTITICVLFSFSFHLNSYTIVTFDVIARLVFLSFTSFWYALCVHVRLWWYFLSPISMFELWICFCFCCFDFVFVSTFLVHKMHTIARNELAATIHFYCYCCRKKNNTNSNNNVVPHTQKV